MSILEQYYQATERDVPAPSGIVYRVRGLSSVEYGSALKGLPALLSSGKGDGGTSISDVMGMQRAVCSFGTIGFTLPGGETSDVGPDVGEWPAADIATVFLAIQEASGLAGPQSDSARGAL